MVASATETVTVTQTTTGRIFLVCGEFRRLLRAVWFHRHYHRGADLAVYERHRAHHGRGAQRHADEPAERADEMTGKPPPGGFFL